MSVPTNRLSGVYRHGPKGLCHGKPFHQRKAAACPYSRNEKNARAALHRTVDRIAGFMSFLVGKRAFGGGAALRRLGNS